MAKSERVNDKPHLTLAQYQARACASNQFKGAPEAKDHLRFGFFGEVGGLLAAVKKSHRDLASAEQNNITEEVGDALWYLTTVAVEYELSLNEVGVAAIAELQRRLTVEDAARPSGELTFHEFDGLIAFCHAKLQAMPISQILCQLAGHAGQIMSGSAEQNLAAQPPLPLLGNLLADMVLVVALFKQNITAIAQANLKKFESRWPPVGVAYVPLFDEEISPLEQFPRKLSMHFIERLTVDGKPYVVQRLNGVNVGDRLTDNRNEPDGYRFHDVFHLAYMAHLGWSPVMRGLLKLKRKSSPDIDENEDGARAMIIEEGIATWIFNHAHRRNYFSDTTKGKLEYGLLKQVLDMVDGYEVEKCPLWQWENAILDGFKVFRELRDAGSGIVHVDLETHSISFEKLEPEPEQPALPVKHRIFVEAALPSAQP